MDYMEKQLVILLILAVVMISVLIAVNYMFWKRDLDNSKYVTLTIKDKVTISSGSGWANDSWTECTYQYNGENYHTNMKPCYLMPGDKVSVRVDSFGRIDTSSVRPV